MECGGINCTHVVFVTIINPVHLEETFCFYARSQELADTLAMVFRDLTVMRVKSTSRNWVACSVRSVSVARL